LRYVHYSKALTFYTLYCNWTILQIYDYLHIFHWTKNLYGQLYHSHDIQRTTFMLLHILVVCHL